MVQKVESPTPGTPHTLARHSGGWVNRGDSAAKQMISVTSLHKGHARFEQYPHIIITGYRSLVCDPVCHLLDYQALYP